MLYRHVCFKRLARYCDFCDCQYKTGRGLVCFMGRLTKKTFLVHWKWHGPSYSCKHLSHYTHGTLETNEGNGYVWRSSLRMHSPWILLRDKGLVIIDDLQYFLPGQNGDWWPITSQRGAIHEWPGVLKCLSEFVCPHCWSWLTCHWPAAVRDSWACGIGQRCTCQWRQSERNAGVWVTEVSAE